MRKFKWCALVFALVMMFNLLAGTFASAADNKVFINEENEVYARILDNFGIYSFLNDDGTFFNDLNGVKRGEAAKSLTSILGYNDINGGSVSHLFIDVPDYHDYAGEISVAVDLGLMRGTGPGEFEPDEVIKLEHFLKALVIALGYDYKAQALGGYPGGYVTVANQLELLEGVNISLNDDLSREALIRILYNSLEVEIPIFEGMSGSYAEYTIMEERTILTEYHHIYNDKAIVQTNDISTLNVYFEPSKESVVIGNDTFNVGNMQDIFNYIGYEVKYYYKAVDDEKTLVWFETTTLNEVRSFTCTDVAKIGTNEISFYKENGKISSFTISDNANIFYNGELAASNIKGLLESFTDNITLLTNDGDGAIDVVFIEDYTYDAVEYVDAEGQKIYLTDHVIDYSKMEYISVEDASGIKIDIEALPAGSIIGFGDTTGTVFTVKVVGSPQSVKIKAIYNDEVKTEADAVYKLHKKLSSNMTAYLKTGKSVRIAVNSNMEIVWADSSAEEVKIGYLIKTLYAEEIFNTLVRCDILGADGQITQYMLEDNITIDGKRVEKEAVKAYLKQTKATQNTTANGETAQLVYYKTDENGVLKQLFTVDSGENGMLLVYNYNERGVAKLRDHGYGSGVFANAYALTKEPPVFRVPDANIEMYDDKYFSVTDYGVSGVFKDGNTYNLDFYKADDIDVVCSAAVLYAAASEPEVSASASLCLVQEVTTELNAEDEAAVKIAGIYEGENREFFVDTSVTVPELSAGDVCAFSLDQVDTVMNISKIYDLETDKILKNPVSKSGTMMYDGMAMLYIYNAPANSLFIEAYETDFSLGVPGDEKKHIVNTRYGRTTDKSTYTFDTVNEEAKIGRPDKTIDYLHDPDEYTRVLIRYGAGYQYETIFYEY